MQRWPHSTTHCPKQLGWETTIEVQLCPLNMVILTVPIATTRFRLGLDARDKDWKILMIGSTKMVCRGERHRDQGTIQGTTWFVSQAKGIVRTWLIEVLGLACLDQLSLQRAIPIHMGNCSATHRHACGGAACMGSVMNCCGALPSTPRDIFLV